MSKKIEKPIKSGKPEKKTEKAEPWKKPIKILKKPSQTEKPNQNWAKPIWTGFCSKNRIEPKPVVLNRFWFLKKNWSHYIFLIKTQPNKN
jgi:hypothetical protein